mgnify:CR=1 FL=1
MVTVPRLVVDVVILLMDLRSLRKAGLLFMYRLDDEDARIVVMQVEEEGRAVLEHRNKLFIAGPSRIKEDVVAEVADAVDDVPGVVQRAVIGIELDDGQAEWPFGFCLFRIPFSCQLAQISFIKAVVVDAADEAVRISGRLQIDRLGTGLNESPDGNGLVVIAIVKD